MVDTTWVNTYGEGHFRESSIGKECFAIPTEGESDNSAFKNKLRKKSGHGTQEKE